MATIKRLEDLEAWQEARKLCIGVYEITKYYPKDEKYNLVKHLRESSRGLMGNIAEGFGRYFFRESMLFYDIAKGCLSEVKSDLLLSFDLKYISLEIHDKFISQMNLVESKINGLIYQTNNQLKKQKL
jgi:four helix bundle protein